MSNPSLGTIVANQNGSYSIPVTYTVTNIGSAVAQSPWYDVAYLSVDGTLDNADQHLNGWPRRGTVLAPGASYTVTGTFTTSTSMAAGSYTLFVKADGHGPTSGNGTNTDPGSLSEANEANNTQALPVTLNGPDLVVSSATVGTIVANPNGSYSIPVTYTVTNNGGLAAQPNWYDMAYLSTDALLDNGDHHLNGWPLRNAALAPGASYTVAATFTTSTSTPAGNYTLFVKADGHGPALGNGTNTDRGNVAEPNDANNTQALPVTLNGPDLVVSNATIGTIVANPNGSYSIPVTYTVTNNGGLAAQPNWYDMAYLSTDAVLDNADQHLNGWPLRNAALAPGASYTVAATFTTSTSTPAGNYTLFVKADGHGPALGNGTNTDRGNVAEPNDANNAQALPITLARPDLVVTSANVGTIAKTTNGSYRITVTYAVQNVGSVTAQPYWYDMAYLSTDGALDNADQHLTGRPRRDAALAPAASYTVTSTFTTSTSTPAGSYTLFIKADGHGPAVGNGTNTDAGSLVEADDANNTRALTITLVP